MTPDLPPVPTATPPFLRPDPLQLSFEGFHEDGLAALARLKAEPHIGRYQTEKAVLRTGIIEPFQRYRDDLALNWVIPNGLPFETEAGVFSRILKNDFGRGGSHHHLWMSFYRRPRKRLTDIQLSHAVYPDAFRFGLYAGDYARGLFQPARARLFREPDVALGLLNDLIAQGYRLAWAPHVTKPEGHPEVTEALDALPDGLARAKGLWVMTRLDGETMRSLGSALVARGIQAQEELWPLYRFLVEAAKD